MSFLRKHTALGVAVLILLSGERALALQMLNDADLGEVLARGSLLWTDRIAPNALSGQLGAGSVTDFTFYRMGVDGVLGLNTNIAKMQLGCGGVNDVLDATVCDIDLDYVSLQGLNTDRNGPGDPVTSEFRLTRPYVELAVKNDGTASQREVVGIKIGFQETSGVMGIGRKYGVGETNQEKGGVCGSGSPASRLNCHTGINSISGMITTEMSAETEARITWSNGNTNTLKGCYGNTASSGDPCSVPFIATRFGSRMGTLLLPNVAVTTTSCTDGAAVQFWTCAGIIEPATDGTSYVDIKQSMRFIHQLVMNKTKDFSLSFQRQAVAYPLYDKSAYQGYRYIDYGDGQGNSDPPSVHRVMAANPGWWMNIPMIQMLGLTPDVIMLSGSDAIDALSEGANIENLELNQVPPANCYGNAKFC